MNQLNSYSSGRTFPVETECTEQGNISHTININLPTEITSKNLQVEGMDNVENSLVDLNSVKDKQQKEENELELGDEESFKMSPTCSVEEDKDLVQSFESDNDTKRQEIQANICYSEFSETGKKMEECSSICSGSNHLPVSDSMSILDEEDNLTQVSDNRPSSSEGESSSLKDGDMPLTDISKTDSIDNSEDMNSASNNQDSQPEDVLYNKIEQETAFISADYESSENCCVGDSSSENNIKPCSSGCQYDEISMQNGSNCNKSPSNTTEHSVSSPVHFEKKTKKRVITHILTKTPQKCKKKTLDTVKKDTLTTSDGDMSIVVEEDNSSPIIANGLYLNGDTRKRSSESLFTRHQQNSLKDAKKSKYVSKTSNTGNREQNFLVSLESTSSDSELSNSSDEDYYSPQKYQQCKKHTLNIFVLLATVFALVTGACLRSVISAKDYRTILYIRFPGQLFSNVLQMLAIPLLVSSLISNLSSLSITVSRHICLRTLLYYLATSLIALMTGIILAVTIQPGTFSLNLPIVKQTIPKVNTLDIILDILRNIFPDNLMVAFFKRFRTEQLEVTNNNSSNNNNHTKATFGTTGASIVSAQSWSQSHMTITTTVPEDVSNGTSTNNTNTNINNKQEEPNTENMYITTSVMDALQGSSPFPDHPSRFEPFLTQIDGTNFLGLVMYSLMIGVAIHCVGDQGRLLADIFTAFYQSTLKLISFITWYSPIGIFFLLTATVIELEEPSTTFHQLALYTGTALVALLGHGMVLLPLVYFLMTQKNPVKFLYKNSLSLFTVFATSNSITTLPMMLQCIECNTKLHHQVTHLTLPLGAIININAGVLYKSVACIFIAQYEGVPLTIGRLIIISITSALVSIGTRNLPQNGNLALLAVLNAASIPNENVSLVLAADWVLNRVGVTVNTIADVVGVGVINHLTPLGDIV